MEFIWKNGVGFKFSIKPRLALGVIALAAAVFVPGYVPGIISILRAALAGY